MNSQTHFKSTITHETIILDLCLNTETAQLFCEIRNKILERLSLSLNIYNIKLFTIDMQEIPEHSIESFANYCDSIQFPALYFKPILYLDLNRLDNIGPLNRPMNTNDLVQQIDPSETETDTDSVPDLVEDDDSYNENYDNNYINNYINNSNSTVYNIENEPNNIVYINQQYGRLANPRNTIIHNNNNNNNIRPQ